MSPDAPYNIAIEKIAEPLDDIRQSAGVILAVESLTRNRQMTLLISEALGRVEDNTYGLCADFAVKTLPIGLTFRPAVRMLPKL
jgi:hypothetical protein